VGKFVEFFGEGTRTLALPDRATIANMAPEYGATMGFFPVDEKTIDYFRGSGRTPEEIEDAVGLAKNSKLVGGADVFQVDPLPQAGQFALKGYTQCPGGIATDAPGYVAHPAYPPGRGVPQWDLLGYSQSGLRFLATLDPGQRFRFPVATLPARR